MDMGPLFYETIWDQIKFRMDRCNPLHDIKIPSRDGSHVRQTERVLERKCKS